MTMIRLEEKELEEQVIATNHHIAVPFEMNHITGEEIGRASCRERV